MSERYPKTFHDLERFNISSKSITRLLLSKNHLFKASGSILKTFKKIENFTEFLDFCSILEKTLSVPNSIEYSGPVEYSMVQKNLFSKNMTSEVFVEQKIICFGQIERSLQLFEVPKFQSATMENTLQSNM